MSLKDKRVTTVEFEHINFEILKKASPDILKVMKDGVDFYFKINLKEHSNKAIVFSNGAYNPKKSAPPVFMRSKWLNDYDSTCICVDDRTLHGKDVRVGWGIGTPDRYYLLDMSSIIKKILKQINVTSPNVIYFGSSAGGFMSLMFSILHKNSNAIVNNPRIYAYKSSSINSIYKGLFPGLTPQKINKKYGGRLSVTYLMNKRNYVPNVLYILNRDSKSDYQEQYIPFIKMAEKYNINLSKISFWLYSDKNNPHDFISREKTAAIIKLYQQKLSL